MVFPLTMRNGSAHLQIRSIKNYFFFISYFTTNTIITCYTTNRVVYFVNINIGDSMQYHQVQVDNEVFEYVKRHAEPLVDDFNSAIKKLLKFYSNFDIDTSKLSKEKKDHFKIKKIPAGTPQALIQILKVAHFVLSGYSRGQATKTVAKEHNSTPQTVIDKYTRQLKISASKFDWLLAQPSCNELRTLLKEIFPNFSSIIDEILG